MKGVDFTSPATLWSISLLLASFIFFLFVIFVAFRVNQFRRRMDKYYYRSQISIEGRPWSFYIAALFVSSTGFSLPFFPDKIISFFTASFAIALIVMLSMAWSLDNRWEETKPSRKMLLPALIFMVSSYGVAIAKETAELLFRDDAHAFGVTHIIGIIFGITIITWYSFTFEEDYLVRFHIKLKQALFTSQKEFFKRLSDDEARMRGDMYA